MCPFSISKLPLVSYCPGPGAKLLPPTPDLPSVVKPRFYLTFFDAFPMLRLYAPGPTLPPVCGLIASEEPSLTPKAPPADLGLG